MCDNLPLSVFTASVRSYNVYWFSYACEQLENYPRVEENQKTWQHRIDLVDLSSKIFVGIQKTRKLIHEKLKHKNFTTCCYLG